MPSAEHPDVPIAAASASEIVKIVSAAAVAGAGTRLQPSHADPLPDAVHEQRHERQFTRTLVRAPAKAPLVAAACALARSLPFQPPRERGGRARLDRGVAAAQLQRAGLLAARGVATEIRWAARLHLQQLPAGPARN